MTELLNSLAWLVCGIYATVPAFWLVIHPFADFWRSRFRAPLKVLGPLWLVMWCVAWTASRPGREQRVLDVPWLWLLAPVFWSLTIYIYFGGKRHFTLMQVIGRPELEPDRQPQQLIITGLHSRMRHPLYAGHLCTLLGWCSVAPTAAVLGLTLFAVVTGALMIRAEDAELEQRFGVSYREYKRTTPALWPKV